MLIGLTRVRNESLIIADTIAHFLTYCPHVILYDDCSVDDTVEIAAIAGGDDITIIHGDEWRPGRTLEETRHRDILLKRAKQMGADWCLYLDADERLIGKLPELKGSAFKFRLFDGYLTPDRQEHYSGGDLAGLPRMWGSEFRDIIMLFRASEARYAGSPRAGREPIISGPITDRSFGLCNLANVVVKHYGKCLSIAHWEETCAYYAQHFPEPYRSKWAARVGKAIHTLSDFGSELYTWNELMVRQYIRG